MTNAYSKMQIQTEAPRESFAIGRNQLGEWYADFGKNYPRTQKYAQETMIGEIQIWTKEVITFVLTQATYIHMNFKIGKYKKYLKEQATCKLETIIDSFIYNYLKNATMNINNLYDACGDWNVVFSSLLSLEALKADNFVERCVKKYGK
jgi:hypothetical protein